MKVEKDLRDSAEIQDERKNGKTARNSVRSFAVLTLFAVLAMVCNGDLFGNKRICRKRQWQ